MKLENHEYEIKYKPKKVIKPFKGKIKKPNSKPLSAIPD